MNLKSLLLACCFCLSMSAFAENTQSHAGAYHLYPGSEQEKTSATDKGSVKMPGFCEIEIVNNSARAISVYGVYEDGVRLPPFAIFAYEYPQYISLYYNGYCHNGMDIYIDSYYFGYHLYAAYTYAGTSLYVNPFQKDQQKVEIRKH